MINNKIVIGGVIVAAIALGISIYFILKKEHMSETSNNPICTITCTDVLQDNKYYNVVKNMANTQKESPLPCAPVIDPYQKVQRSPQYVPTGCTDPKTCAPRLFQVKTPNTIGPSRKVFAHTNDYYAMDDKNCSNLHKLIPCQEG